jgi:hypothetical protein
MSEIGAMRLPTDPDEMNDDRAKWAQKTLDFFAEHFGENTPYGANSEQQNAMASQNLADLLCDFGHFSDRFGLNFLGLLRMAEGKYKEETENEGRQFNHKHELNNLSLGG